MNSIISRVDKIINNMKIRYKILFTYLIAAIGSILIIGVYLTTRMTSIVMENAKNEARYNNVTIKYRVDELLTLAINTSDMIYQDDKLHKLAKRQYENSLEVFKAYQEYPVLSNYLRYYSELLNIRLYVDNPTMLSNSNLLRVDESTRESDWYLKAVKDRGVISWRYRYDEISKTYSLSLIRSIDTQVDGHIGVLVISIQPGNLNNIVNKEQYASTILVDDIVVASTEYNNGDKIEFDNEKDGLVVNKDDSKEYSNNLDYKIINTFNINKSFNNSFKVLVHIPIYKIKGQANLVIRTSIIMISFAIIVSMLIIFYFSKKISDRVNIISNEMSKVVKGDFNISKTIDGKDEIGQLHNDLCTMMESVKELIDEVYVKEIQKEQLMLKQKEAQFKMLASQINPHFLYNTLETIRMRAYCNGDRELADIVLKLGKIMRRNLEVSDKDVLLESEIELIRNYLEIQGLRFKGKVEYEFKIEVDAKKYSILPLLLQPIVENAFVHGLEGSKEKGKIIVSIFEDLGYLIVEISDNGMGISKENLELINSNLGNTINTNKKKSIGMGNINERIKIFYGEEYGLYVLSTQGVGTKVVILLPALEGEEEC